MDVLRERDAFRLEIPEGVVLAHEGAHIITAPYTEKLFQKYGQLFPSGPDYLDSARFVEEMIAMHTEIDAIRMFHPDLERSYIEWRSGLRDIVYSTAWRILQDHPEN